MIIDLKEEIIMENQNEIMEVVEQGSSKKVLKKVAIVAAGIAAGVAGVVLWKKRKAKQLSEEIEISEDSNESEEK